MSRKQELTAQSLTEQFLTVWGKLGGGRNEKYKKYRFWNAETLHHILFEKGLTAEQRTSFGTPDGSVACDYTPEELMVCIAKMYQMLAQYKSMWDKYWRADKAANEASRAEDDRVRRECFTWGQCADYLREHSLAYKLVEVFEPVRKIGENTYWKKREKITRLYTEAEALRLYRQYFGNDETAFDATFEAVKIEGWDGELYRAKFELVAA